MSNRIQNKTIILEDMNDRNITLSHELDSWENFILFISSIERKEYEKAETF